VASEVGHGKGEGGNLGLIVASLAATSFQGIEGRQRRENQVKREERNVKS
jgi:hypothetical protein